MERLSIGDLLVMLIEPSLAQGRIISRSLQETGVDDTLWVRNGTEALAQMRRTPPDLVISAMYLPDMTASALVETMRAEPELEQLPFMLVSSETGFERLDPVRQAGAVAILPKPFLPADLRRALHATLDLLSPEEDALADLDLTEVHALVVDDSLTARRHIARVLGNVGVTHITEAADGREAIALLGERFFDLLVTDYNMPEVDGKELVQYVREQSNQRSMPILMVTSESDASRLAAVRQAGTSAICDKPFETAAVRDLIREMLAAG